MSFELMKVGRFGPVNALERGECSVGHDGKLRLLAADLAGVNVTDRAVVLFDRGNLRLAVRAPRVDEAACVVRVSVVARGDKSDGGRRTVNAAAAVRELGLTLDAVRGRYPVVAHDDLLTVTLLSAPVSTTEAQRIGRRGFAARKAKAGSDRDRVKAADGLH